LYGGAAVEQKRDLNAVGENGERRQGCNGEAHGHDREAEARKGGTAKISWWRTNHLGGAAEILNQLLRGIGLIFGAVKR